MYGEAGRLLAQRHRIERENRQMRNDFLAAVTCLALAGAAYVALGYLESIAQVPPTPIRYGGSHMYLK